MLSITSADSSKQSRRWCFTLNNYTEEDLTFWDSAVLNNVVTYVLYAKEVGQECGTPHLQGYLELAKKKTLKGLKSTLQATIHLEVAKGSLAQQVAYISKQSTPVTFGTPMAQGKRNDLEEVKDLLDSGASMAAIAETHFSNFIRYERGFRSYINLSRQSRNRDPPEVYALVGKPGTGKTRYVHDKHEDIWSWGGDRWFDGYDGHEIALFDDFDGGDLSYRMLLRVLDRYPMKVPVKGGFSVWIPRRIYLTSNLRPEQWYNLEDPAALLRRIKVIEFPLAEGQEEATPPQGASIGVLGSSTTPLPEAAAEGLGRSTIIKW